MIKWGDDMENITIGQISIWLAFVVALYTSVKFIVKEVSTAVDKGLEPINEKISEVDLNATKNFLVSALDDINRGEVIEAVKKQRFYEQYEHYTKLGGNSYIVAEVDRLKKENKL